MSHHQFKIDPCLDLVLERNVDVSRELIWAAWTKPEWGSTKGGRFASISSWR